jgi:N-acetylmuramoyl-L-alanine amidase
MPRSGALRARVILEAAVVCLALNIYHEARGEPYLGQLAVAMVTLNRAKRQLARVCEEVFEPRQFSWTGDATLFPIREPAAFEQSMRLARIALTVQDFTGGANHYHADYIAQPAWAKKMQFLGKIGQHLFYKG